MLLEVRVVRQFVVARSDSCQSAEEHEMEPWRVGARLVAWPIDGQQATTGWGLAELSWVFVNRHVV